YAAPEQFAGQVAALSPACDIYSLGVVLFEMLTGQPPFVGDLDELQWIALREPAPPPSRQRPGLSSAIDAVCARALAKQPADRYASMDEFGAALRTARLLLVEPDVMGSSSDGQQAHDRIPGRWKSVTQRAGRHKILSIAVAIVVFFGAGALLTRGVNRLTITAPTASSGTALAAPSSASPSKIVFSLDEQAPELKVVRQQPWKDRHAFVTRFSAKGDYFWAGGEFHGHEKIRVWETATGNQVFETVGGYFRFREPTQEVFYPIRGSDSRVDVGKLNSTDTPWTFSRDPNWPIDMEITPDGRRMITTRPYGATIWDVATRQVLYDVPLDSSAYPFLTLMSDGHTALAYDAAGSNAEVCAIDVSTGKTGTRFLDPFAADHRLLRASDHGTQFAIVHRRAITVWDYSSAQPVRQLEQAQGGGVISACAISRDICWALCTREGSNTAFLINLETGKTHGVSHALDHHAMGHHDFSPDGRLAIICTDWPSTLYLLAMPAEVWRSK
ncbi:MAG TPA: hypothetical protein VGJ26_06700, partial [Pirellulales bacterium]